MPTKVIRPSCEVKGCRNLVMLRERRNGVARYRKVCGTHHKKKYGMENGGKGGKSRVRQLTFHPCERCGWDESYCDRHRIDPQIGYTEDNIIVLCPNCHRIETCGRLDFSNR